MSNVKRKDSKNRNLRNGESQRKDGRYVYKYTDIYGKPQFIYSWKLVPTDKTPAGKRDDISLREKEAQIKKDLNDGIDTAGGKMTVCQLCDKKNSQRKNIKRATEKGRNEKTVKIAICVMERASEKTEDTFINIPIYTESHNLFILGNLYRQTRHLLENVMIYR